MRAEDELEEKWAQPVTLTGQLDAHSMKCPAFHSPILEGLSHCGPGRAKDTAEL